MPLQDTVAEFIEYAETVVPAKAETPQTRLLGVVDSRLCGNDQGFLDEETIMPTIAETWEARGEKRGEKRGNALGALEHTRYILLRQLTQRFSAPPGAIIQQIESADLETLDSYLDRVLVATGLDDIFETHQ